MLITPDDAFDLMPSLPRCRGLSGESISAWESQAGIGVPKTIRRILAVTGQDMGWLFSEGLHQLEDVAQHRNVANELLEDAGADFRVTESEIVLELYEGDGLPCFSCGQDDPEIFERFEVQKQPRSSGKRLGVSTVSAIRRYLSLANSDVAAQ
jgi:hypothetical protein